MSKETVYKTLTECEAIAIAKRLQFFKESNHLTCKEIGDGNLNLVFRIKDNITEESIIIKQALPYAKVVGESWPLTLDRSRIEGQSLLIQAKFVPEYVPKVLYTDDNLAITIMEDLSHLQILRNALIEGCRMPLLPIHIGDYLAKTLFYTSDFAMNQQEKKLLVKQFINPELCKITEDLVFTDPFFNHQTNHYESTLQPDIDLIWQDKELKLSVAKLKQKFLTKTEALIHGDLHTGSIFANENETKIIDPEFAYYGPMGFDVGQIFAHFLLNAITCDAGNQKVLHEYIEKTWEVFVTIFSEVWRNDALEIYTQVDGYLEHVLAEIFEDAVGFAGCEMIRRIIGLAHVMDIERIQPDKKRIATKHYALSLGRNLILNQKSITKPSQIFKYLKQTVTQ